MADKFQVSSTLSMIPEALQDEEKSFESLKQLLTAKREKNVTETYDEISTMSNQRWKQILEEKKILQEEIQQYNLDTECFRKQVYQMDLERNAIREKIVTEKQYLSKMVLPDENELVELMAKVSALKDGIAQKKNEMKTELNKYKRGILFYKKYLHCTVVFTSKDELMVTFDTSSKPDSVREYLKFSILDNGTNFQLLEMQPKLGIKQQLINKFNETQDTQGLIAAFWNAIKEAHPRRILSERN